MAGRMSIGSANVPYVDEFSNLKINDAIRGVAEQAFAPFSEMAEGTDSSQTIDSGTYAELTGISIDLVVPVPSRVRAHVTVRAENTTYASGDRLRVALFRDGSEVAGTVQVWEPGAVGEHNTISFSYLQEDLLPGTTYTYTVEAKVDPVTSGVYSVVGTRSNLILTTEGRQRV